MSYRGLTAADRGQSTGLHSIPFKLDTLRGRRTSLGARMSHDSGLPVDRGGAADLTLGHIVSSRFELDAVMTQPEAASAFIFKPAHDTLWGGYAGYFQDPDRHLWEVVWNPELLPRDEA